jgi:hypothetical protein
MKVDDDGRTVRTRRSIPGQEPQAIGRRQLNALVARVTQNDGYNFFSLTRASAVVNCQSALA